MASASASSSSISMGGDEGSSGAREAFEQLKEKLKEISCLEGVASLLSWDQQVYMPPNGVATRGAQQGVIARVAHAHKTSDAIGAALEALSRAEPLHGFLTPAEIASVREAAREYNRTKKKPVELAARAAALEANGVAAWQKARKENDFAIFAPVLQEWIDIAREETAAVADPGTDVYDYCLDRFERGLTVARLEPLFASLKTPLIALVKQIQAKADTRNDLLDGVELSVDTQMVVARQFAEEIGFDFASGRFDVSTHPMTIPVGSPFDVRITSRFRETELSSGLLATLHEAGHGLYEQGLDAQARAAGLPASKPPGMGLHESQSLLWEKQVGMSMEFWEHYWPVVQRSFSDSLNPAIAASDYHKLINEVRPGMIRVEADEVSYPLHILLRFEIEKGLLDGSLQVADIPAIWNQKMEEYLGIVPKDDVEGCLQDIHWSMGLFGYFPTYTLGAVYASMIFLAAEKQIPGLRKQIQDGKFSQLREWLREKIHSVGSLYETADELIEQVTGSKLDAKCFLDYLSRKYGALYNLSTPELQQATSR